MRSVGMIDDPALLNSPGDAHVQALIYISKKKKINNGTSDETSRTKDSVDITVVQWASPSKRSAYELLRKQTLDGIPDPVMDTGLSSKEKYLGDAIISGDDYLVFRRNDVNDEGAGGDLGELANYFLLRKYDLDYNTTKSLSQVDIKEVVVGIETLEKTRTDGSSFRDLTDWFVSLAGWEVTGASGTRGAFKFDCYVIPTLNSKVGGSALSGCWN
jgi:hypothetical protein